MVLQPDFFTEMFLRKLLQRQYLPLERSVLILYSVFYIVCLSLVLCQCLPSLHQSLVHDHLIIQLPHLCLDLSIYAK